MIKPAIGETSLGPTMGAALLHPLCGVAMIMWWVNDQLLKRHAPGVVSGKLSDVACLAVFPVFVWCLVDGPARWLSPRGYAARHERRMALFFVTTSLVTAWFVLINVSFTFGDVHRHVWERVYVTLVSLFAWLGVEWRVVAHHTVDLTDLLALPALGVAWYVVNTSVVGSGKPDPRRSQRPLSDSA